MRAPFLLPLCLLSVGCAATPRLAVGPAPPGVYVDARLQYYEINAASLGEIRSALAREGIRIEGRRWSAATDWRVNWTYRYNTRGVGGCELQDVRVNVRAIVTFPRWNPTAQPDSALLAWWEQFNRGLAEHERGHAIIAVKVGGQIARALEQMRGGTCDALAIRANEIGRSYLMGAMQQQQVYDRETRHGATQIRQAGRLREP